MGRVTEHELAGGQLETFAYHPDGNVASHTDFNGDTTLFGYSPCCGRLVEKTFADGSSVSFTYTGTGKRETVTDGRGTTSFAYDTRGRLVQENRPDGSVISYTYDAVGNRTSVTVGSGTTTYVFDALNRLSTVTDPDSGVTTYAYDAVGNRVSITYPNGTVTEYAYDDLNRLTYMENRSSIGDVLTSYDYTLGPAGNRTRVVENSGRSVDYTYDALYRLIEEAIVDPVSGSETIGYTYDDFGNRLTKSDSSGVVSYVYDANDRLVTEAGPGYVYTYAYDANGNTIEKDDGIAAIAYVYDYENRLIQVDNGIIITAYGYDADGIRVSSETDGVETVFVVDKNRQYAQVLEERDGTGSLTVSYVYGDDLISQDRGGNAFYYLYDGQLSTRALNNAGEDITDVYTYDAFGVILDQAGTTENNYRYTGEQFDPNAGFYYLRARYYDQGVGRFVTTDPYQGRMHEPVTLHKYLYANVNPVMFIDPNGLMFASIQATMINISLRSSQLWLGYRTGQYTIRYVARMAKGLNWELEILKNVLLRYGNIFVQWQKFIQGSRRSIDIMLSRSASGIRNVLIEAKGWNWDYIAKSPGRVEGMLKQLESQASYYYGKSYEMIYAFMQSANTPEGKAFMDKAFNIIEKNGHKITVGTEALLEKVGRLL